MDARGNQVGNSSGGAPSRREVISETAKAAIMGGVMGFLFCFIANYFFIPMPVDAMANSMNNAISGCISGFNGGLIGMAVYFLMKHRSAKKRSVAASASGESAA